MQSSAEIVLLKEIPFIEESKLPKAIRVLGNMRYVNFNKNICQIESHSETLLVDLRNILIPVNTVCDQLISFIGILTSININEIMDILKLLHDTENRAQINEMYPLKTVRVLVASLIIPSSTSLDINLYEKTLIKRRHFLQTMKEKDDREKVVSDIQN